MSHETVHFRVWRGWKSLFERSTGFSFPGALYGRRRMRTLLGTPFWGQKIILNSEYSARVLFNRATFFPEGPLCSWFDIFPSFSLLWSYSPKYTLQKRASTPFFTTTSPPLDGVPQRNDDDNRPRTSKKYTEPIRLKFLHFSPFKCFITVFLFRKKIKMVILLFFRLILELPTSLCW